MDRVPEEIRTGRAGLAPLLSACTESPETAFDWGVNDRLPARHVARNEVTRSDLPQVYVYQGSAYAVPAPKPRPVIPRALSAPAYQAPSYRRRPTSRPPIGQSAMRPALSGRFRAM